MSKRLISIFRGIAVFSVVFSLFIFNGCNKSDDPIPPFEGTIYDLITSDEFKQAVSLDSTTALDSLVKYLNQSPTLVALLDGATEYTLFAPSNKAFKNLLATPGFPSNIADINPNLIAGVLSYHIVTGAMTTTDLTPTGAGAGISSLYTDIAVCPPNTPTVQVIKVNNDGTLLTGSANKVLEIVDADNQTTINGVVHVTESVLIPFSVEATLTPILGKHSATVLLGADFTYLAQVMTKADCGVGGVTPLSAMLSSTGPFTVFLPLNDVWLPTAQAIYGPGGTVAQLINGFTAQQWRDIILNHIVAGTNNNAALVNTFQMTTSQNANAKLTVSTGAAGDPTVDPTKSPYGKYLTTSGGATGLGGTANAPIYLVDLAVANGVDHVVGRILFPN